MAVIGPWASHPVASLPALPNLFSEFEIQSVDSLTPVRLTLAGCLRQSSPSLALAPGFSAMTPGAWECSGEIPVREPNGRHERGRRSQLIRLNLSRAFAVPRFPALAHDGGAAGRRVPVTFCGAQVCLHLTEHASTMPASEHLSRFTGLGSLGRVCWRGGRPRLR